MKSRMCDGLEQFRGAESGLRCAKGLRASRRCGCSGGPASWDWLFLEAVVDTAQVRLTCFRYVGDATWSSNSPN